MCAKNLTSGDAASSCAVQWQRRQILQWLSTQTHALLTHLHTSTKLKVSSTNYFHQRVSSDHETVIFSQNTYR